MGAETRLAPPGPLARPASLPVIATRLEDRPFTIVRRGFEPTEVRTALCSAAREIDRLRDELKALAAELEESDSKVRDRVRESTAAGFLGDEAARMLAATKAAAAELEERAAERSQHLIDDAKFRSAAVLLEMEQETARRYDDLDKLEEAARQEGVAAAAEIREDAELYAESIRASADAYASEVRAAAEAEAAALLALVDEQIVEITEAAEADAEQVNRDIEVQVAERFDEVERRQQEMAERLTRERVEITEQRDSVDRLRSEIIDLLDRLQAVAASGLVELNADDPFDHA